MPLYEYQCSKCKKTFEVIQKFSDEPLKKHEGCGGKVQRLMSAPAFHLKGSGWYVTDYAGGGKKPTETETSPSTETKSSESSATTESASTETKAESKPKKKSEPKTAGSKKTS
jgi:putative FmdB family regulatory protein